MIHYLIIGHACDEEQTWMHLMFNDEQPHKYLEKKFTNHVLKELELLQREGIAINIVDKIKQTSAKIFGLNN